jgi:hypothetical protein
VKSASQISNTKKQAPKYNRKKIHFNLPNKNYKNNPRIKVNATLKSADFNPPKRNPIIKTKA